MKLIDFNRHPTERQLKQFGISCLVFLPLLAWLATGRPRQLADANVPLLASITGVAAVIALLACIRPRWVQPLFVGISLVTLPIGLVVGELVLALVFGLVFVPMALVFRLLGRDALQRRLERGAESYWQEKPETRDVHRYYRQY